MTPREAKLAGMGEDGRGVALDVLVEPDAGLGLGHDRCERGLADLKRITPQVVPAQFDQVEGVEEDAFGVGAMADTAQLVVGDSKNTITLARSSADVSPPYGFMLLPGTTSSGFAMNRSSFSLSHTKSAPFMALE
jgi:hypothetical protein